MKKIFAIIIILLLSCSLAGCILIPSEVNVPYIQDGYWYIDGVNTGVRAEGVDGTNGRDGLDGKDGADGENGKTPYIQDGFWYIDGKNTGVKAEGVDGAD